MNTSRVRVLSQQESHVTYMTVCDVTHITWMSHSCMSYELLIHMAHISVSHGTYTNESWHIYEWVMAHIWVSHCIYMSETWHIYEWVIAHIWVSHGTYMSESWHIYEWVMAHIWVSHGTYRRVNRRTFIDESLKTHEWVVEHAGIRRDTRTQLSIQVVEEIGVSHSLHTQQSGIQHTWIRRVAHPLVTHTLVTHTHLSIRDVEEIGMSHWKYTSESWNIYEWGLSCEMCQWVMSTYTNEFCQHIRMSYVNIYEWVMSTYTKSYVNIYEWVMSWQNLYEWDMSRTHSCLYKS